MTDHKTKISKAADDVLAERLRQIKHYEWTAEHDDTHTDGSLATVAALYCSPDLIYCKAAHVNGGISFNDPWPESWFDGYDKRPLNDDNEVLANFSSSPLTRRRLLVKAGALIIAEIERLDRAVIITKEEKK